jgi:hypothetical protein
MPARARDRLEQFVLAARFFCFRAFGICTIFGPLSPERVGSCKYTHRAKRSAKRPSPSRALILQPCAGTETTTHGPVRGQAGCSSHRGATSRHLAPNATLFRNVCTPARHESRSIGPRMATPSPSTGHETVRAAATAVKPRHPFLQSVRQLPRGQARGSLCQDRFVLVSSCLSPKKHFANIFPSYGLGYAAELSSVQTFQKQLCNAGPNNAPMRQ